MESAPATLTGTPKGGRFEVGWLCPICGRNTLRAFDLGALAFDRSSLGTAEPAAVAGGIASVT